MKKDKKKNKKEKVIVAMSGGIDSSVAAALLKEEGYDVIGIFMKFWSESGKDKPFGAAQGWPENSCCTLESEKRARAVAKILKIPFYVFNFEKEFKKKVVDYFLADFSSGNTPNPCVVCNKEIKFGLLMEKALALGADYIATGHYAQKREQKTKNKKQKTYQLLRGKDKEKDQSYFLWQLSQEQLKHVLFPVGDYTKAETRKLAKKFRLPVLTIPESQEICFVPDGINNFLQRNLKQKVGKIVDEKGKILGTHKGLAFYTIGQRKGIGLAGGPYYVEGKDQKNNLLIVNKNQKGLFKKELVMKNVNWISGKNLKMPLRINTKIRYRNTPAEAVISYNEKFRVHSVKFKVPQKAITPGQSAVFYKEEELIGGGIINS